jgi:hypothetical protein
VWPSFGLWVPHEPVVKHQSRTVPVGETRRGMRGRPASTRTMPNPALVSSAGRGELRPRLCADNRSMRCFPQRVATGSVGALAAAADFAADSVALNLGLVAIGLRSRATAGPPIAGHHYGATGRRAEAPPGRRQAIGRAMFGACLSYLGDIGAGRKMPGCILIEGYTCCGTYTASSRSKKSR